MTIRLAEEVGGSTVQSLRRVLNDAPASGRVVMDMTDSVFVDHGVIGAIAAAARSRTDRGAGMCVICPRPGLLRVLREARIADSVRVVSSEAEVPPLMNATNR